MHTQDLPTIRTSPMRVLSTAEHGLRLRLLATTGTESWATRACGSSANAGDTVLVTTATDGNAYVIGVIPTAPAPAVEQDGPVLRVRDVHGDVVLEFDQTKSIIRLPGQRDLNLAAAQGDLILSAKGHVRVMGGLGIDLVSCGTVRTMSTGNATPSSVSVGADGIHAKADSFGLHGALAHARVDDVRFEAKRSDVRVGTVRATVGRLEATSQVLVYRTRDLFCEVSRLSQTTASRIRMIVRGGFLLRSARTHMRSSETTRIDGEQIHLG